MTPAQQQDLFPAPQPHMLAAPITSAPQRLDKGADLDVPEDSTSRPWESLTFVVESSLRAAVRLGLDPAPWQGRLIRLQAEAASKNGP